MSRLHHLFVLGLGIVLVVTGLVVVAPGAAEAAAPTTGRYFPVATARAFSGTVGTTPKVVTIAGRNGVPVGATAVVLNVEVDVPTRAGYVRVTPAGSDPSVATQEFRAGQTISNLTTVKLTGGKVQTKLSAGSATVHFDVSGYYGSGAGSTYTPVDAARVFAGSKVGTSPVRVPLAGTGGVPSNATAVAVNVAVEQQTADGYVRVTAAGQDPSVAAQVYQRGTAVSNLVVVGLTGGAAQVKVSRGTATVFMDVVGYYSPSTTGSVFVPVDTVRVATTAVSTTPRTVRVTGTAGVPGTATAVVANVEVSAPTATGYLRVTPSGQDARVATQDHVRGQEISALTMPKVVGSSVDRRVQAKVSAGTATVFVDVSGYFLDGSSGSGFGADISSPQCAAQGSAAISGSVPSDQAFGVVGVNGGLANQTNSCLAPELAWAAASRGGTSQPKVQLYVNTANPGSKASVWPGSNTIPGGPTVRNPYGTCTGGFDKPCSYVYGYTRAYEDATSRGITSPSAYRWWLDVEIGGPTGGTWQTDTAQNRADLEGMTAYFSGIGAQVGLYSTSYQLGLVAGPVPSSSSLYRLPSWVATGASSPAVAQRACSGSPLTGGGKVVMTQYVAGGIDRNVSCV